MADSIYLLEKLFNLEELAKVSYVGVDTQHPQARVIDVNLRSDYADAGQVMKRWVVLTVKDKGFVGREPKQSLTVVVVRRDGGVTPIPDDAGSYVGKLALGAVAWFVFEVSKGRAEAALSLGPGKTSVPQSPARASAPAASHKASAGSPGDPEENLW